MFFVLAEIVFAHAGYRVFVDVMTPDEEVVEGRQGGEVSLERGV